MAKQLLHMEHLTVQACNMQGSAACKVARLDLSSSIQELVNYFRQNPGDWEIEHVSYDPTTKSGNFRVRKTLTTVADDSSDEDEG